MLRWHEHRCANFYFAHADFAPWLQQLPHKASHTQVVAACCPWCCGLLIHSVILSWCHNKSTPAPLPVLQRRIGKARSFTLHRLSRSSSTGSPSILVGGALGGASLRRSKRSAVQALAAQQQAEDAAGKAGKVGTGKPPLNKKGVLEISIFAGSAPQAGGRALKAKDSELFEAAEGLAVSKLPS